MPLSILSNNGFRKAVVSDADGVTITYYRVDLDGTCRFDREARPALPFHAALDLATKIVNNAPPKLGGRW